MKSDRYTKVVLTAVAVCLCIIVVQNRALVGEARLQNRLSRRVMDVELVGIDRAYFGDWDAIDVNIANEPVRIMGSVDCD